MIRHIVLFKLKSFESETLKNTKAQKIKLDLETLPAIIPEIKLMNVGINTNPEEQFDISLVTEFASMEDLHTYAVHPKHLAVGKIIREVLEARACVDSVI